MKRLSKFERETLDKVTAYQRSAILAARSWIPAWTAKHHRACALDNLRTFYRRQAAS
jgi:hypothetical protein